MPRTRPAAAGDNRICVIGAGIGGLAAAIRLAAAGRAVTLFEAAPTPGGKARSLPGPTGPVDAGPTVLTLRDVFDDLFAVSGAALGDCVTLTALPVLARHFWDDGSRLDLYPDPEANARAIRAFAGPRAEEQFRAFARHAASLRAAFESAVMRAPRPLPGAILRAALANPALWPALMPGRSLAADLRMRLDDARLRQLLGRYATYVGGSPQVAPAVLSLIWQVEESGVWAVRGGISALARALADRAQALGVDIRLNTPIARLMTDGSRMIGVQPRGGAALACAAVVFNGDPAALGGGLLGPDLARALPRRATHPRSLSARVWAFAARPSGPDLAYHNVFFAASETDEFAPLARGETPAQPSIYVCAQDRAGAPPDGAERFEMILNAPPLPHQPEDFDTCRQRTFDRLSRFGLSFDQLPGPGALTLPQDFASLFPGSAGSLYGRSPAGVMATMLRPGAQSRIPGLYLAGGGAHPGAGVPMAALSGRFAAEAVMRDLGSTSTSRRTATAGGMSTGSATAAPAPSR